MIAFTAGDAYEMDLTGLLNCRPEVTSIACETPVPEGRGQKIVVLVCGVSTGAHGAPEMKTATGSYQDKKE